MTRFMSSRFIVVAAIMSVVMVEVEGVESVAAGRRRRRRNLRNMISCGKGQHAIWNSYKRVIGCEDCPPNTYRPDDVHYTENCIVCPGGRQANIDHTHCIGEICPIGKFGVAGAVGCTDCAAGKYSVAGSFSCRECESGRYNSEAGSGVCLGQMCAAGKYGLVGQTARDHTTCQPCESGKWSSVGGGVCRHCPEGQYSGSESSTCYTHEKCPTNSFYKVQPSTSSDKIVCERCIYADDITSAAYYIAVMVACVNTLLFLAKIKSYCYVLLFIVCAGGWASWLNFCAGRKRGDTSIIISMVMNSLCLCGFYFAVRKACLSLICKYVKHCTLPCWKNTGENTDDEAGEKKKVANTKHTANISIL